MKIPNGKIALQAMNVIASTVFDQAVKLGAFTD
jgi:hypothetical protein